jgi:hypothetical protein
MSRAGHRPASDRSGRHIRVRRAAAVLAVVAALAGPVAGPSVAARVPGAPPASDRVAVLADGSWCC